jgi:hypothetical protein
LPGAADSRLASNILQTSVCLLGIVSLFLLLFAVWWRLTHQPSHKGLSKTAQEQKVQLLDSAAWKSQASRWAKEGNWKEACRAIYLSALRLFDERSILEFSPTRTNYEYFYSLARFQKLADSFRMLAQIEEFIWFGDREAASDDYQQSLELLKEIELDSSSLPDVKQITISGTIKNNVP